MRVIAGIAKGRILTGPKTDKIRPALDKVKQALFNILGPIDEMQVLDLFAGTGSIGIEALSRGAGRAVFIDENPEALKIIRKNLELCRFANANILRLKLPREIFILKRKFAAFDLIFIDPPYDRNLVNPSLRAVAQEKILAPGGRVIVEHSPREAIVNDYSMGVQGRVGSPLILYDQRQYGQTWISFLAEGTK